MGGSRRTAASPDWVLCVGASAGGVASLSMFVGGLSVDLDATVLVVLHLPPNAGTALDRILGRAGALPVRQARDGEPLPRGVVLVARPDRHLLVDGLRVRVGGGPREGGFRPAIDPLFRSAATSFGERVVAVLLSGMGNDGTAGAATVKAAGGQVIVQDPEEAEHGQMPGGAIERVDVDAVAPAVELGAIARSFGTMS